MHYNSTLLTVSDTFSYCLYAPCFENKIAKTKSAQKVYALQTKKKKVMLHGYKVVECCIPFNYFFLSLLIVNSSILLLQILREL